MTMNMEGDHGGEKEMVSVTFSRMTKREACGEEDEEEEEEEDAPSRGMLTEITLFPFRIR